jgi:hypothetical protein
MVGTTSLPVSIPHSPCPHLHCTHVHRAKLFERINSHPTLFEVVTGQAKGNSKPAVQQVTAGSKRKEGVMVRRSAVPAVAEGPDLCDGCYTPSTANMPHCTTAGSCMQQCPQQQAVFTDVSNCQTCLGLLHVSEYSSLRLTRAQPDKTWLAGAKVRTLCSMAVLYCAAIVRCCSVCPAA